MSRMTKLGLVVAAVATLGACSSMHDKSAMAAQPENAKVVGLQTDAQYVNRVERLARERGIALTWVNPPAKHPQPTQSN